ncbi:MAG: S1 RNA-binding domain-containing protein [Armatimonadetes bacterium]|nr:S1 RNA-binding domain-containing protein [Armatimonadota bacterium]
MVIKPGNTVEGTVIKLAKYGAIVRLAGGRMGLVHISEVADAYVRDVKDYFKENDKVCVKVLKMNENGRYELSMKQADPNGAASPKQPSPTRSHQPTIRRFDVDQEQATSRMPLTFEDRLSKFLKESDERLLDLKRNMEAKRGSRRR